MVPAISSGGSFRSDYEHRADPYLAGVRPSHATALHFSEPSTRAIQASHTYDLIKSRGGSLYSPALWVVAVHRKRRRKGGVTRGGEGEGQLVTGAKD